MKILKNVREFTVEANPETVTGDLMGILAQGGVNRVSIGAQSFQTPLLKALERWHDPQNVRRAVQCVRDAGIQNINLDLMFAIPGQTESDLQSDLGAALDLGATHLSCYSLIYEPQTPLHTKRALGRVRPVSEELETAMFQGVMDRLGEAGFEHYEISNWATRSPVQGPKPSPGSRHGPEPRTSPPRVASGDLNPEPSPFRCRHNLIYWQNGSWLGLGPSAASHIGGHRWKNEAHLGRYLAQGPHPRIVEHEQLPPPRQAGETLMLGLRMLEGIAWPRVERILPPEDDRHPAIDQLIELGMLERTRTHLKLTRRGLFVADSVMTRLL